MNTKEQEATELLSLIKETIDISKNQSNRLIETIQPLFSLYPKEIINEAINTIFPIKGLRILGGSNPEKKQIEGDSNILAYALLAILKEPNSNSLNDFHSFLKILKNNNINLYSENNNLTLTDPFHPKKYEKISSFEVLFLLSPEFGSTFGPTFRGILSKEMDIINEKIGMNILNNVTLFEHSLDFIKKIDQKTTDVIVLLLEKYGKADIKIQESIIPFALELAPFIDRRTLGKAIIYAPEFSERAKQLYESQILKQSTKKFPKQRNKIKL